jgi:hypothetical protein
MRLGTIVPDKPLAKPGFGRAANESKQKSAASAVVLLGACGRGEASSAGFSSADSQRFSAHPLKGFRPVHSKPFQKGSDYRTDRAPPKTGHIVC